MSKIFEALRKAEQEPNPLAPRDVRPPTSASSPGHPRDQRLLELEFGRLSSAVQSCFPKAKTGKVLLVVGCVEREGATYVATNLARVLARTTGEPTLCLDANFHDASLTRASSQDGLGLADIYENGRARDVAPMLRNGDVKNLYVLGTGRARVVPGALFDSPEFDSLLTSFRRTFRFVVVDGAPLLKHPDSIHLAARSDGVLFVVRYKHLKREVIRKGVEMIESVNAPILGAVLNRRKFAIPDLIHKLIS
jgi:Mrp family chromosome partitioning ATPase